MHSFAVKPNLRHRDRAFTLVEMLVVIAIMSILMTAGAIGLGGMSGKGVSSGVASAESLFDEARSIATGQRIKTRVLIAETLNNNPAENRRRLLVVGQSVAANGTVDPDKWVVTSRGVLLPDQVYFSEVYSVKDQTSGSGDLPTMKSGDISGVKQAFAGEYFYYEFNAEGICSTPGASFVVGTGARGVTPAAAKEQPKVTSAGKRDFGGFVVWRNGNTSVFRSPEQISPTIKSLNAGSSF
jgi:prepilin-type N-terminal cleavage/methylation domain-containing protein